jgi:hypothetical protein
MNTSAYAQYGMYAFLATLTLAATYLKIMPVETGIPIFAGLVGTVVGWHIPSPTEKATTKTDVTEAPH